MRAALLRTLPARALVEEQALLELLRRLKAADYHFITPTPLTQERVLARQPRAATLRDVFGWNLSFERSAIDAEIFDCATRGGAFVEEGSKFRSRYRVASQREVLFLHSAYPTDDEDSVFFGPDSYRFVRFLRATLSGDERNLVDFGAGSGVGGICASLLLRDASITLVDRNAEAICLARLNASAAGVNVETINAASLDAVDTAFDTLIANPPYMVDAQCRTYRDGGDLKGARLSLDWALAGARRLPPGGKVLLYTGTAIVEGRDALKEALAAALPDLGCTLNYDEIDPDVFGEHLAEPAYADVERIAVIGAIIQRGQD